MIYDEYTLFLVPAASQPGSQPTSRMGGVAWGYIRGAVWDLRWCVDSLGAGERRNAQVAQTNQHCLGAMDLIDNSGTPTGALQCCSWQAPQGPTRCTARDDRRDSGATPPCSITRLGSGALRRCFVARPALARQAAGGLAAPPWA